MNKRSGIKKQLPEVFVATFLSFFFPQVSVLPKEYDLQGIFFHPRACSGRLSAIISRSPPPAVASVPSAFG
jgi:hypothetical protein